MDITIVTPPSFEVTLQTLKYQINLVPDQGPTGPITIVTPPPFEVTLQTLKCQIDLVLGQGPAGPPGPQGPVASSTEIIQSVPSDTWIINHNLGWRPNVTTLSVGGVYMLAEVVHISNNQLRIYFDSPQTGIAILS